MNVSRIVAGLTLALVAFTGCSEQAAQDAVDDARDEAGSVIDEAELQERLDSLAEKADCSGLKEELAKVEGNDAETTKYIKAQIEALDC